MGRPTFSNRGFLVDQSALLDTTVPNRALIDINGSKLLASSVGLTQAATVIERKLEIISIAATPAKAQSYCVFRGPTSGAVITSLALSPGTGSSQPNTVPRSKNWIFSVVNKRTGLSLNKNACSFGGVGFATLAATAWKTIPVNNGNSTVQSGETLWIAFTVSSTPVTMKYPAVAVEWTPLNNA